MELWAVVGLIVLGGLVGIAGAALALGLLRASASNESFLERLDRERIEERDDAARQGAARRASADGEGNGNGDAD